MNSINFDVEIKAIEYNLASICESLETLKEYNSSWDIENIYSKTGIKLRYISNENETALKLGLEAAKNLISKNKIRPSEIDALIFVSQTPEYFLPATSCIIQEKLELPTTTLAFDINLGHSGFIYALHLLCGLIQSNSIKNAIIVCADTYTKYIRKNDRTNRPIFSDAGSASLISKSKKSKIGFFKLGTDGKGYKNLIVKNGAAASNFLGGPELFMDGAKLYMFTMAKIPILVTEILNNAKLSISDIDMFVFHQASKIVLDGIQDNLGIKNKSFFRNLEEIGNTVSSTIPIAIHNLLKNNCYDNFRLKFIK